MKELVSTYQMTILNSLFGNGLKLLYDICESEISYLKQKLKSGYGSNQNECTFEEYLENISSEKNKGMNDLTDDESKMRYANFGQYIERKEFDRFAKW